MQTYLFTLYCYVTEFSPGSRSTHMRSWLVNEDDELNGLNGPDEFCGPSPIKGVAFFTEIIFGRTFATQGSSEVSPLEP